MPSRGGVLTLKYSLSRSESYLVVNSPGLYNLELATGPF